MTPIRRLDPPPSDPEPTQADEVQAGRLRHERAVARAEAAEARAEEWRWAEVAARSELGSLKSHFQANREKLTEAREELKAIRQGSKDTLYLRQEVQRLTELLAAARVDPGKRSTAVSLRMQVAELREENGWLRERLSESLGGVGARGRGAGSRDALAERSRNRGELIKSMRTERAGLRKQVTRLNRELVRLQGRLDRQKEQSESFKTTMKNRYGKCSGKKLARRLGWSSDGLMGIERTISLVGAVDESFLGLDGGSTGSQIIGSGAELAKKVFVRVS